MCQEVSRLAGYEGDAMSKKSQQILEQVQRYFDDKVLGLSPTDYLDVIQGMASTLESYEDCLNDEMKEEEP